MSEIAESHEVSTESFDSTESEGLYGTDAVDAFEALYDGGEGEEQGQPEPAPTQEENEPEKAAEEQEPQVEYPMPEGWEQAMWEEEGMRWGRKAEQEIYLQASSVFHLLSLIV